MPQFVKADHQMPPDPGLLDILSSQNKTSASDNANNCESAATSYLSYHLHPGTSTTASVIYANWLGNEHKNNHIFGLQGIECFVFVSLFLLFFLFSFAY